MKLLPTYSKDRGGLAVAALTIVKEGAFAAEGMGPVPAHASRKKGANSTVKNFVKRQTMSASKKNHLNVKKTQICRLKHKNRSWGIRFVDGQAQANLIEKMGECGFWLCLS
jgi:hypothetical protein